MYKVSAGPISTSTVNIEFTRLYLNQALLYKTVVVFLLCLKLKLSFFGVLLLDEVY